MSPALRTHLSAIMGALKARDKAGATNMLHDYPLIDFIAHDFASRVLDEMDPDYIQAMRDENTARQDSSCSSHDYMDANMPMAETFETMRGGEFPRIFDQPDGREGEDVARWNAAWAIAKARYLSN